MKKIVLSLKLYFLFLLIIPLVYAGDYGVGSYGAGDYGVGEVAPAPKDEGAPSGNGAAACTYDWDCTNWFPTECPESGVQERICANRGTCPGIVGMPNQTRNCTYEGPTEPLFDIFLTIPYPYTEICAGQKIKAKVNLINLGKIELLDAFMTYWIINQNNTLIAELKDTRAVGDKINFDTEIKIPKLTPQGTYRLYAQITYADNKTAVAGESFEVIGGTYCKIYSIIIKYAYFILIVIISLIIIILIILLIKRKRRKRLKQMMEYKGVE